MQILGVNGQTDRRCRPGRVHASAARLVNLLLEEPELVVSIHEPMIRVGYDGDAG